MRCRDIHVGQHVGLAVVDEHAKLRPLVAELVGPGRVRQRRAQRRHAAGGHGLIVPTLLERTETLVTITAAHNPSGSGPSDLAADVGLFLHLDMAVLGSSRAEYDAYEQDFRGIRTGLWSGTVRGSQAAQMNTAGGF